MGYRAGMSKDDKSARPKARTPRGFRDRFGAEIAAERDMLARISRVYESYGFDPLETPAFEYTDALGKFLPDVDRPNQGVFSVQDDDGQWMSLRYDLTAPLARYVAENYDALPKPFRRYAVGAVWRNEKPGPGRYRQFVQCDADTVGAPAPDADVEAILMMNEALVAASAGALDFIIRFSDRRVLTGLLGALGIDETQDPGKKASVLRAMDKYDRLGEAGVAALLGAGRKDDSGDFTPGAGLDDAAIARALAFMGAAQATNAASCARLADLVGGSAAGAAGVETLASMSAQLSALGLDEARARIDLSVVRGLEYYTGPIFEAELISVLKDEKGRPLRLGSIASGGRYDGLVERFKGIAAPAVGVSVGVSRLLAAMEREAPPAPAGDVVVVLAFEPGEMAAYQTIARELRAAGLRAEVYLGGAGMRAQMKYADKRGARIAVIQGPDERARGEATIKDLALGAELSKEIETREDWKSARPAQRVVARAGLVDAVKAMISQRP